MKRIKNALTLMGEIVAATLATPGFAAAAVHQPPEQEQKQPYERPFQGKVDSVNAAAKTMTVEGKVMTVTDATRLTKLGKPIKLNDVMAGEEVHGTSRQMADGRAEALTVNVGPREKDQN